MLLVRHGQAQCIRVFSVCRLTAAPAHTAGCWACARAWCKGTRSNSNSVAVAPEREHSLTRGASVQCTVGITGRRPQSYHSPTTVLQYHTYSATVAHLTWTPSNSPHGASSPPLRPLGVGTSRTRKMCCSMRLYPHFIHWPKGTEFTKHVCTQSQAMRYEFTKHVRTQSQAMRTRPRGNYS